MGGIKKIVEDGSEHPQTRVLKDSAEIFSYMKSIAESADEQSTRTIYTLLKPILIWE